ncbi:UNVERIFIED_CONTAM: hypothetical protein GTU68_057498 [Idotea baltica]|nr:hypothetical protein [Idotea baltica]
MGVSGSGKSSVGQLLADQLGLVFIDADDHHPTSNIEKMKLGIPLTDEDRFPWLTRLQQLAVDHLETGCVIACSALKESYRMWLSKSIEDKTIWIYLKGHCDLISQRIQDRKGHFMKGHMLKSQFEALEEPKDAVVIEITDPLEVIVGKIKMELK